MGQLGRTKDGLYPDLSLNEAVELVEKIDAVGGSVGLTTLAKIVGIDPRGAGLRSRVEDLKAYGLVEENGGVKLSGVGRDVARGNAVKIWEAFVNIPLYAKMHERLEGKEVDAEVFHQILYEITKATDDDAITRRAVRLKNNYTEALQYLPRKGFMGRVHGEMTTETLQTDANLSEIMKSDLTLIDRGNKLFIVIQKDLHQVGLAKSFLENVEKSIKKSSANKRADTDKKSQTEPKKDADRKNPATEQTHQ